MFVNTAAQARIAQWYRTFRSAARSRQDAHRGDGRRATAMLICGAGGCAAPRRATWRDGLVGACRARAQEPRRAVSHLRALDVVRAVRQRASTGGSTSTRTRDIRAGSWIRPPRSTVSRCMASAGAGSSLRRRARFPRGSPRCPLRCRPGSSAGPPGGDHRGRLAPHGYRFSARARRGSERLSRRCSPRTTRPGRDTSAMRCSIIDSICEYRRSSRRWPTTGQLLVFGGTATCLVRGRATPSSGCASSRRTRGWSSSRTASIVRRRLPGEKVASRVETFPRVKRLACRRRRGRRARGRRIFFARQPFSWGTRRTEPRARTDAPMERPPFVERDHVHHVLPEIADQPTPRTAAHSRRRRRHRRGSTYSSVSLHAPAPRASSAIGPSRSPAWERRTGSLTAFTLHRELRQVRALFRALEARRADRRHRDAPVARPTPTDA